jgi:hypothetical protein
VSASLDPAPSPRHPVSLSTAGSAIQAVQGTYYLLAGLAVAFAVGSIDAPSWNPADPVRHLWLVRGIALAVAGFGAVLLASGIRAEGPFLTAGAGLGVAFALLVLGCAAMGTGVLPPKFLLDSGLEVLFLVWWGAVVFGREARTMEHSTVLPSV